MTADTCACGKPLAHIDAHPDSAEWACRVPDPRAPVNLIARLREQRNGYNNLGRIQARIIANLNSRIGELADDLDAEGREDVARRVRALLPTEAGVSA